MKNKLFNFSGVHCIIFIAIFLGSCTKLDQKLNGSLTQSQFANALGAGGTQLLLAKAYTDVGPMYTDLAGIHALEEVTTDEAVVPTRAGDWDDNGKWRALHQQTYTPDAVDVINGEFTNLNTLNFDATNVLAFNPNPNQAAQARVLRALSLYQLLDLFGKYPWRNPGEDLLKPATVYSGQQAFQFIVNDLKAALPNLSKSKQGNIDSANQDVAKVLLMRMYLNHGAFLNVAKPSFADSDMMNVITLGNEIINSGRYSYMKNYFDNFNPNNSKSTEIIYAYPNTAGVSTNNSGVTNRWYPTLHYNSFAPKAPQAGWNGFSTVADLYNSFGVGKTMTMTAADTSVDPRLGGRFYSGVTDVSGLRPGFLVGQQYAANGAPEFDRKGNLLSFTPVIASDLKETGNNLEITGIRVLKYPPDFSADRNGNAYGNYNGSAGNWVSILRYSDVVLMVAEAKMRLSTADNAGAMALVNDLRSHRGTFPLTSMSLFNPATVSDPNTLLAERSRELYWESVRRTDLIRFGMFQMPWALKAASDVTHILLPIPSAQVSANQNLSQNPGY